MNEPDCIIIGNVDQRQRDRYFDAKNILKLAIAAEVRRDRRDDSKIAEWQEELDTLKIRGAVGTVTRL